MKYFFWNGSRLDWVAVMSYIGLCGTFFKTKCGIYVARSHDVSPHGEQQRGKFTLNNCNRNVCVCVCCKFVNDISVQYSALLFLLIDRSIPPCWLHCDLDTCYWHCNLSFPRCRFSQLSGSTYTLSFNPVSSIAHAVLQLDFFQHLQNFKRNWFCKFDSLIN